MRQSKVLVTCEDCGAQIKLPAIAVFHLGKYADPAMRCSGCTFCLECHNTTKVQ